jgi:hypothetical protein
MFGLNLKLVLGVAVLAVIGGLITLQHFTVKRLNAAKAELRTAHATLEAERAARAHELKIAREASNDYQTRLAKLATDKAATPTRHVRLCRQTDSGVPATASATSGTDSGTAAEQPGTSGPNIEAGPDIGVELYALADEADQRAAQCNALIGWLRAR